LSDEFEEAIMMKFTRQTCATASRLPFLLVCALALGSAFAAPEPFRPIPKYEMVVLVAMDGISIHDVDAWELPVYRTLFEQGGLALLNNRTADAPLLENNAVTISAGTRAISYDNANELLPPYARLGANADEWLDGASAVEVLTRNTGATAGIDTVVHPGIAALRQLNATLPYPVEPGLLGGALQQAGVWTGVYGNADRGPERDRSVSLIAMNPTGWADFGDVGTAAQLPAHDRPFGVRTNFPYFMRQITLLPPGRYFIVIDAGDGARLEAAKPYLTPERYAELQRQNAQECGVFMEGLQQYLHRYSEHYRIILTSLAPDRDALRQGDQLAPLLMLGTGISRGLLTSSSTRRPGLVLNIDLTASVLRFFQAKSPPPGLRGNPITALPRTGSLPRLVAMNRQMVATYMARGPVIKGYLFVLAFSLFASLALVLAGTRVRRVRALAWTPLLRPLLIAVMLGPLVFLAAGALHIYNTLFTALFMTVVSLAAAGALHRWVRDLRLIFAVIGATALVLSLDVLAGVPLLRHSIFSYDPIAGIRFYGFGNESAGALIGTALLGVFALLDYFKASRWWLLPAGLFFLVLVVLDGAPMWGADFGGILAGLAGYGIALLKARGAITRRILIAAAITALVIFAALIVYNLAVPPDSQSHFGHAITQAREYGAGSLLDTAVRKWSMNLYLMQSSWWALALASLLTVVIVVFFRPSGILRQTLRPHPLLNAAFIGDLAAMLVGLCTNDSGVVMASVGMLYLSAPILLLIQAERDTEPAAAKTAVESANQ